MTSEDTTADVPISNWALATGTKPGARNVYSPHARSTARHVQSVAKSGQELRDASRSRPNSEGELGARAHGRSSGWFSEYFPASGCRPATRSPRCQRGATVMDWHRAQRRHAGAAAG